jgi:urease accessory protein
MSDWLTWQIVDSAFPTGAFAHSFGLESGWQHGEIAGAAELRDYLHASLLQAAYATLPLVNAAYDSPERFEALDVRAETFLINAVANRASRIQGRTTLATVTRVWPSAELSELSRRAAYTCSHVAPVTGAAFRIVGIPLVDTRKVVLFAGARAVTSAAVRLGIIGSYEAQRLQWDCAPWLDQLLERAESLDESDLAQTVPIADILQSRHDRLYSRLFQS